MRILLVGPSPDGRGGIATLIRNMLKYRYNGYCYQMHVARPDGGFLKKLMLVPFYTLFFLLRITFIKYDIVHIHTSENWGYYRYIPFILYPKMLGKKVVIHSNACEFDQFYERVSVLQKRLIRYTLNKADLIITVSREWAEVFKSITDTRVEVVFNFIDVPEINHYNLEAFNITATGQVCRRKGHYDFIQAIAEIIKFNNKVKFVFCGNGDIEEISLISKKLSVDKSVKITGWLSNEEIQETLKDSMLFVLPTYNEGMPLAILEAMSFGLPVITTPVGGIPSLVTAEENGILINPGDLSALEKSILELIHDKTRRMETSKRNYEKVKKYHSIEGNMKKIHLLYDSIIK